MDSWRLLATTGLQRLHLMIHGLPGTFHRGQRGIREPEPDMGNDSQGEPGRASRNLE